jgi:transforming growth factor-beta-induced protein
MSTIINGRGRVLPFAVAAAFLAGCGSDSPTEPQLNIVATAEATGQFNTLLTALQAAGLTQELATGGPYTVFAPTDAAFSALPAGTLDVLLADTELLQQVLLSHVVQGEVRSGQATQLSTAPTLSGFNAPVQVNGSALVVGGATVVTADVEASNGVIHVIDSVILPFGSLVEVAQGAGVFNTLLAAATAAGLDQTLASGGPFTVFAPTDAAFAALPAGTVDALLQDVDALRNILLYHVVDGVVYSAQARGLTGAPMLNGGTAPIEATAGGGLRIAGANVVQADVLARNGVVHVVDAVLLP